MDMAVTELGDKQGFYQRRLVLCRRIDHYEQTGLLLVHSKIGKLCALKGIDLFYRQATAIGKLGNLVRGTAE